MNLNPEKTAKRILKLLTDKDEPVLSSLEKAYRETLRLRSQLIGIINGRKQFGAAREEPLPVMRAVDKQRVTLTVPEPLPSMKELTAAVEEHWVAMIHEAIAQEAQTGIPYWEKAHVQIEITTARGTNNRNVWDTSNRAINVIINNLKGIFFWDDDFQHLSFGINANWGEIGETKIKICAFEDRFQG